MPYRISYSDTATRALKRLPGYFRAWARREIDALAQDPRPPRARELRDEPGTYRVWLKGWRLIYFIDDDDQAIWVMDIRPKTGPDTYEGLDEIE